MSYLTEAFKQLNIIDEDLFPTDSEGLNKLKDFMKSDIDDEDLVVYDETANNEDEIKDSYNGKVILRCNVCKSYFFKEPKSIIIDAEAGLANVGDECCYCHNDMGYNVVGVVAPYAADVSKEERAEDAHEEPAEANVDVDDVDVRPEDVNESVKRINESDVTVGVINDTLNRCYGKHNVAFKYDSGKEAVNFHKVVVNWANKNRKHVIELRAATLEDIVPGINSATGERIESDVLKLIKAEGSRSIIYIEDIDRISDDVRHEIGELVRDMTGHVVATAYDKSKVDQSIAMRFKWLSSVNESVNTINEETNYDKVMRVLNDMKKEEPVKEARDNYKKAPVMEELDLDTIEFDNPGQAVEVGLRATDKLLDDPEKVDEFIEHIKSEYNLKGDEIIYLEDLVATTLESDNFHTEAEKYYRGKLPIRYAENLTDADEAYIERMFDECSTKSDLEDLLFKSINNLSLELGESVNKVNEDLKDVSITTNDTKIQMTSEENGKVTVTTEPVKNEVNIEDAEVVKPLSAADKDVIANNDGEDGEEVLDDTAIDFDEINDKDLDKLGEKYFTKVYDNVKSFKSTACKLDESGVILEGKITFKSGKEAKTAFNFNEAYITKTGKVKLIGENAQFAKNKKAFTLTGSLNDKKLVVESFTYNYRTKDEKTGKSTRLYGTVSK